MKKIIINQLRREGDEKLSIEEYKELIETLKKKYNMSYNDIVTKTNIPKSTLHRLVSGKNYDTRIVFNIDNVIKAIKKLKPKREDYKKLKELKYEIERILVNEILYKE